MNILLLNHYAGSPEMGMEFRPYYLAREWVRMGHKVTIVAGDFSHLRSYNPEVRADFQEEIVSGITYCWIRTGSYEGNGAARAMSMFRFVAKLRRGAKLLVKKYKPNVVVASSTYPLDTFAAQRIARMANARYVHEVHDMWPITLIELGKMSKRHPFVVLMQIAEDSFCKNSDAVVSLLPAAKEYFIEHGMRPEAFHSVMNGVVEEEWTSPEPLSDEIDQAIESFKKDKEFVICFFGSHTKSYALNYLVSAVQDNVHMVGAVFVGQGSQRDQLIQQSLVLHPERFLFLPPVPKKCIPSLLKRMDAVYIGALRNDMFRFGVCMNKLFDSMMSGTPILYAVDAPNNLIDDHQCGVSVEPENTHALVEGIDTMLKLSKDQLKQMGENGHLAVISQYTYKKLAEQFLKALHA